MFICENGCNQLFYDLFLSLFVWSVWPGSTIASCHTVSLLVPSGAPTNVVVKATSAWQLNVKWDLPDDDERNGNITKYQVKYEKSRVEKFIKNTTGSEREILLERSDGIKPYTGYSVSVSAFTAKGQGPFSDSKSGETPQAGRLLLY